jgi:hypothetical protein
MARVHDYYDAGERRPRLQIRVDERLPLRAQRVGRAREAVARKVDQPRLRPAFLSKRIEVDGLRAARGLAGERQTLALDQRVDRARLADVRAPGEGQLGRPRGRNIAWAAGRREKLCLRE